MDIADNVLIEGEGTATLILAHGAGAPMDSAFMNLLSRYVAEAGIRVVRFEFPYMAARREDGRKRPPNNQRQLLDCWWASIDGVRERFGGDSLFIGGKSMGGRMASLLAADPAINERGVKGCLCFGYPFHPPGKPDKWRVEHLSALNVPLWIAQGERDPFGRFPEVSPRIAAWPQVTLWPVAEGDHDFRPTKRGGFTQEGVMREAAEAAAAFMLQQAG